MIAAESFADKSVALFGLGGSGRATALSLVEGGARLVAFDDNPDSVAAAAAAGIPTGDLRDVHWSDLAALVLAPGVPLTHPRPHWTVELARAASVPVIGDIELFSRERSVRAPEAPLVAITGTNGKSTTTALIAHCLRSAGRDTQMGGNIGVAVMTLEPPAPERHYVLECSSYQIDLAPTLAPSIGILLNLTPDHLDRHGTMSHYAAIKARLVAGSDTAVIGIDDAHCRGIAEELEGEGKRVIRISQASDASAAVGFDGTALLRRMPGLPEVSFTLAGIGSLRGRHNAQNAAAAVAALSLAGLSPDEIETGLQSFPGLAHRMETVGRQGDVLFVNDSKATNADAAATALASFPRIHWIAGGLAKEGGIAPLAPFFPKIVKAYLIGEAAPAFAATLGKRIPYEISDTLDVAVRHAAADAAAGGGEEVVLLSPACASFDQFRNFEVRGDAFREAVGRLPGIEMVQRG
ncbi:UDP-N-acetylmuramoyl-L-alanine--D-glutamate ligase [Aurantimonas endophytica]|uniref:UDP-N-acetylmuramoylalanine--D-glutamate ligase n=1 Tax=Aurantimonas endophytica TaxID=1522175 RepID=A0A7W6HBR8_9HYPH|nr:UDP-N-acetylmuramoyl-L-alanine--D-glutamate ligase [Aurantimonas endophytica]MBB4002309.1 UDP-N-acetylmuramoylalanine--D-glutamate ligase [Aurantimonas endophytica]MCO6402067.1 UDP-N-acetylmuramoyl-L-alanine--D-glutamate ligase [Aurantimonas endophytica]